MKKLYRSRKDRVFAGVCGGIAEYLGIDSTVIRLITFLLIVPGGLSIWVYIALAIIIPSEPYGNVIDESYGEKFNEPDKKEKTYEDNYRNIYENQKKKSNDDFYWEEVQGDLFLVEKIFKKFIKFLRILENLSLNYFLYLILIYWYNKGEVL